MRLGAVVVCAAIALGSFAAPTRASAQLADRLDVPDPPDGDLAPVDVTPRVPTNWGVAPDVREGIRDPEYAYEADDGIVWNGAMWFLAFYVNGVATTLPFTVAGCCVDSAWSVLAFVPFVQWASAFGGSFVPVIGGGLFAGLQIVAAIVFAAGVFHHREALRPGPRREAGDISLAGDGVEIAF